MKEIVVSKRFEKALGILFTIACFLPFISAFSEILRWIYPAWDNGYAISLVKLVLILEIFIMCGYTLYEALKKKNEARHYMLVLKPIAILGVT